MLQLKEFLKTLGWTVYESSAYCAIVENGPMKANDLAIKSGIPPGRIYEVISTLANKGWLKKTGMRPTIYDAQNPRLVLERELDKLEKEMTESLETAEEAWELRTGRIGDLDDKSWTVSGIHGIILEVRSLCLGAKKSIKIVESALGWLTGSDVHKFEDLSKKNIKISVIGTDAYINDLRRLSDTGIDANVSKKQNMSFYIIDDEIVLMKLNSPDSGTIVRDENIAKMFVTKFDKMIKMAKKVEVEKVVS